MVFASYIILFNLFVEPSFKPTEKPPGWDRSWSLLLFHWWNFMLYNADSLLRGCRLDHGEGDGFEFPIIWDSHSLYNSVGCRIYVAGMLKDTFLWFTENWQNHFIWSFVVFSPVFANCVTLAKQVFRIITVMY